MNIFQRIQFTIVAFSILATAAGTPARAERVSWFVRYDQAAAASRKSGKPMMIDFYTSWCGWCKKLDRDVYTDSDVCKLADSFIPLKINAEVYPKIAAKFGVNGYPNIFFIDPNGKQLNVIGGYTPPQNFARFMRQA